MTAQQGAPEGQTLGALVHQLSQQIPELIRSEIRLAQAEVAEKGKRAGVGIGMFSVAGLLAFFALAALVTTAILGLATIVDAWLAALIVAVVLLALAAVVGLMGKNKVAEATPAVPARAIQGIKDDVATVKGAHRG
ncbi:phage holin family protein [Nocardioides zhouii]|uniref:Phage holin family protein n=1 Tax=Nocardioides zhouii TaxID=1168729 RepID=A0A4Q2T6R9_9ACTN|nr:phage holin family protein [Nocardioides zhouii]RYC14585.1 phage holin family protein [Nocardioides zhouii]